MPTCSCGISTWKKLEPSVYFRDYKTAVEPNHVNEIVPWNRGWRDGTGDIYLGEKMLNILVTDDKDVKVDTYTVRLNFYDPDITIIYYCLKAQLKDGLKQIILPVGDDGCQMFRFYLTRKQTRAIIRQIKCSDWRFLTIELRGIAHGKHHG